MACSNCSADSRAPGDRARIQSGDGTGGQPVGEEYLPARPAGEQAREEQGGTGLPEHPLDVAALAGHPGHAAIVASALRAADIALVPIQPTVLDVDRVAATAELIADAQALDELSAAVLLTRGRTRTRALDAAREVLAEYGLYVMAADVPQRESLAAAFGDRLDDLGPYRPVLAELHDRHGGVRMSDRAGDKMRGRLGRTAPVTRQAREGSASAAGEPAAVRKVRITVDLPADGHRALRVLAAQEGVDGQRVVRACLAALRAGGKAADEILAILRRS